MNKVCFAWKVHWKLICGFHTTSVLLCIFFPSIVYVSLWTINLLHAYPSLARTAGSIICLSLLTVTVTHLSPPSLQPLILHSKLRDWRHPSRKGQTASPRQSDPRRSTGPHRWDKPLGIRHLVWLRWFLLRVLQSHWKECSLLINCWSNQLSKKIKRSPHPSHPGFKRCHLAFWEIVMGRFSQFIDQAVWWKVSTAVLVPLWAAKC